MSGLLDSFLAANPSLESQRGRLERAAASDAPVLIVGEAGSGRTSLARALHSRSSRAGGPLVEVDVSTIPSELFESELFGHRAGAFSGAERTRVGRVEAAAGGTLLLDHLEELPLASQPKLLRLLAEGCYAPLGGREHTADVRFLSIAADDLEQRVERGTFRQDLYYRLEVLAFRVAPLRRRRHDIVPLATAILADLSRRYGHAEVELDESSRTWIRAHRWPGNSRQLRNALERALVLHEGAGRLRLDHPTVDSDRPPSLLEVEREAIRQALAFTRGHQGRAAEVLGISRKALWEKRKRLGIP